MKNKYRHNSWSVISRKTENIQITTNHIRYKLFASLRVESSSPFFFVSDFFFHFFCSLLLLSPITILTTYYTAPNTYRGYEHSSGLACVHQSCVSAAGRTPRATRRSLISLRRGMASS